MKEFQKILENFKEEYKKAENIGLIKNKFINNYDDANKNSLHSRIQYLLIKSGEKAGFISVPEMKIEQQPTNYGIEETKSKQGIYRTDVVFYDEKVKLVGISEIFTMDMLAHLQIHKVTSACKILHLLKTSSPSIDNILLVCVLPQNTTKTPSWKEFKEIANDSKDLFKIFSPLIAKLEAEIKKLNKNSYHIKITENGIKD